MVIVNDIKEIIELFKNPPPLGITIGNFDGVHLGHQELLRTIKDECIEKKLRFGVITFIPHPQKIIHPEKSRFLIYNYDDRKKLLKEAGVDFLIEMDFSRDFSTLEPEFFLRNHLLKYPSLKKFFLGYDFAFGANKSGGQEIISRVCRPHQIDVEVQPQFYFNDQIISSSIIRTHINQGSIRDLKSYLGRAFHLKGVVVKGEGRGKKIGFPTANIQISEDVIIPKRGVYVTQTHYNGMIYKSITNIGHNPTFNKSHHLTIETNIFDFNIDIYGEPLKIEFYDRVREEKKFATVNDLVTQIQSDISYAKSYLENE